MIKIYIFKLKTGLSYRETEKFFKNNGIWKKLNLKKPIGKSTIQEISKKIDKDYLEKIDNRLAILEKTQNV